VHSTLVAQASRDATAGTFTLPSNSYSPCGTLLFQLITRLWMTSYAQRRLYLQLRVLNPVQPGFTAFGTFGILPATPPVGHSHSAMDFTRREPRVFEISHRVESAWTWSFLEPTPGCSGSHSNDRDLKDSSRGRRVTRFVNRGDPLVPNH